MDNEKLETAGMRLPAEFDVARQLGDAAAIAGLAAKGAAATRMTWED